MHFNLEMLNVWIGLCRGAHGVPDDLYRLGYRTAGIERKFAAANGRSANPEMIVASESESHCLMLECKAGKNVSSDQLDRYAAVTAVDLVQRAGQSQRSVGQHGLVILADGQHGDHIANYLKRSGRDLPLIVRTVDGLSLLVGSTGKHPFDSTFAPGLALDWDTAPRGFVPVDPESETAEIAELVMQQVTAAMLRWEPSVTSSRICEGVFLLTWPEMGADARANMRSRVNAILKDAASNELRAFFSFEKARKGLVSFTEKVQGDDPAKTVRRSMRTAQQSFLMRLASPQLQLPFDD